MNRMQSISDKSLYRIGLVIFLLTAIFSAGYFHADEHFQLLEFANYKLGLSPAEDLPWEFTDQIRPTIQASLAFLFLKVLHVLGLSNPFYQTILLRLITAILAWVVYKKTIPLLINAQKQELKLLIAAIFFIWFVPLLSVRFSSENYASLSFLTALVLLLNAQKRKRVEHVNFLLTGLLLGLSFYFRFQIAFAIIGLGFWLLFVKKITLKNWGLIILGGLFAVGLNTLIDYWFYDNWCITSWNYFEANIIEHKAASFGTSPWHAYITLFIGKAVPPISVLMLIFFVWGAIKNKMHVVLWCIAPFLIGHFVVGHKEIRFLFPLMIPFIYLCLIGYKAVIQKTKKWKYNSFSWLMNLSIVVNIVLLLFVVFSPARPCIKAYQFLYNYSNKESGQIILSREESIYRQVGLETNFYKAPKLTNTILEKEESLASYLNQHEPDRILFLQKRIDDSVHVNNYKRTVIYSGIPSWLFRFNYNNWLNRSNIWQVIEYRKKP